MINKRIEIKIAAGYRGRVRKSSANFAPRLGLKLMMQTLDQLQFLFRQYLGAIWADTKNQRRRDIRKIVLFRFVQIRRAVIMESSGPRGHCIPHHSSSH